MFEFANLATACLRALITSLLKDRETQERLVQLRKGGTSEKVPNAIAYIKKYSGVNPPKNNDLSKAHQS